MKRFWLLSVLFSIFFTTIMFGQVPMNAFRGDYYNNINFTDPPTGTRDESNIWFDWGTGGPGIPGVPPTWFSARFTGDWNLSDGGTYTFYLAAVDDVMRVYIDGVLLGSECRCTPPSCPTSCTFTTNLTSGVHRIVVEYIQYDGPAVAKLTWWLNDFGSGFPWGLGIVSGQGEESLAVQAGARWVKYDVLWRWIEPDPPTGPPSGIWGQKRCCASC